jgi:GxxExxY protein
MPEQLKHDDITRRIIGCAMRVHTQLGNSFVESVYQKSLEIEMTLEGLSFVREKAMSIYVGRRRVDFFVENLIMVELKALIEMDDVHLVQALNYLEAYNIEIGLLINFGSKSLTFKRLLNKKIKI